MKQDKFRYWKIGGGLLGVVTLGLFGYIFGRFGFPGLDFSRNFEELRDPDATGTLFGWLFAFIGFPVGAPLGRQVGERYRARQRRQKWLADHPEQAAEIAAQKQQRREQEQQRARRRR